VEIAWIILSIFATAGDDKGVFWKMVWRMGKKRGGDKSTFFWVTLPEELTLDSSSKAKEFLETRERFRWGTRQGKEGGGTWRCRNAESEISSLKSSCQKISWSNPCPKTEQTSVLQSQPCRDRPCRRAWQSPLPQCRSYCNDRTHLSNGTVGSRDEDGKREEPRGGDLGSVHERFWMEKNFLFLITTRTQLIPLRPRELFLLLQIRIILRRESEETGRRGRRGGRRKTWSIFGLDAEILNFGFMEGDMGGVRRLFSVYSFNTVAVATSKRPLVGFSAGAWCSS
jgi:hypothetical protein